MIRLHNTLSGRTEEFKPNTQGEVQLYHCGPTVYDHVHIGNLRSYVFADTLRRLFEYEGYNVTQVINITDIGHLVTDGDDGEDKMTKGLRREGRPITLEAMRELSEFYTRAFEADLSRLNIKAPHVMPRASEHIKEEIELIKRLEEKGLAYKTSDGIYFDTGKDTGYGKLGGIGIKNQESRITENPEKKNSADFALWKFNEKLGFPSPWGQGFPGWHIECSAMSMKYLGETFDIHTGGVDLAPIHHNNEIAQSENATGEPLARYWLHNEFINLSNEKMAKSEGNVIKLSDITERGFSPLSYRYFLLLSHYRSKANFSWDALEAAQNAYRKLKEFIAQNHEAGIKNQEYIDKFKASLEDDLNTPEALSVVWKLVKDESVSSADKHATLLDFDQVLGLKLAENEFELKEIPAEIKSLMDERKKARLEKDFKRSDELREEIRKLGYEVGDTDSGQELKRL